MLKEVPGEILKFYKDKEYVMEFIQT